jgi:hypothetical protein
MTFKKEMALLNSETDAPGTFSIQKIFCLASMKDSDIVISIKLIISS